MLSCDASCIFATIGCVQGTKHAQRKILAALLTSGVAPVGVHGHVLLRCVHCHTRYASDAHPRDVKLGLLTQFISIPFRTSCVAALKAKQYTSAAFVHAAQHNAMQFIKHLLFP